jgi:hypothetical protein
MAHSKKIAEDPYERLANAIVLQAVDDYRRALRAVKRNPSNKNAIDEALNIERFFRSGWYSTLTSIDGEYLILRLQEEIRQSELIRGRNHKTKSEVDYEQTSE